LLNDVVKLTPQANWQEKKMKTIITAWPDSDSWIVSEDCVEDTYRGGTNTCAICTTTLDVCDTYDEAVHRAREIALERMLPAYKQDRQGFESILFDPTWEHVGTEN
jgi:hypothetical protein